MKQLLVALLFAGVVFGSPIPVAGAGTFGLDHEMDGGTSFWFSGSNGTDSVSFGGYIALGNSVPDSLYGSSRNPYSAPPLYTATIDDVSSYYWSLSLADGAGSLTIFDSAWNLVKTQDLAGTIEITSYQEFGTPFRADGSFNTGWSARGGFDIVPPSPVSIGALAADTALPEGGTGLLTAAGLLALVGRKWKNGEQGQKPGSPLSPPARM